MLNNNTRSTPNHLLDTFFLLFGLALASIIVGAIYLHKPCSTDVAKWLIIFGSVAMALWLVQQLHVYSWGGRYDGTGSSILVLLLTLATIALGIVAAVKAFRLGVPYNDKCHRGLHLGSFILMIIFCVVAGLILLQMLFNRRRHGVLIVQHNRTRSIV